MKLKKRTIYLDSNATTPVDEEVLSEMLPFFTQYYGNGNHKEGWKTTAALENARSQIANCIGARPSEMVFTSGATEAINIALMGLVKANTSKRKHIITQKTEHKAVLECINELEKQGFIVSMLDVDSVGRIDLEELEREISHNTLIVAIMLVNNEIGTIQPVKEIGAICKMHGAKYFCDATQGLGWYPIDVDSMNIDLAAMSSHKVYGPKGIGALFVRKQKGKIHLKPILFGGGQEQSIRPGTPNVPAAVGFGKACELYQENRIQIVSIIRMMRDRLQERIFNSIEGVSLNGCSIRRHPGNLNIVIPGIVGEELKEKLSHVMFSTTSACSSTSNMPSHVLVAVHNDIELSSSSIRFGITKFNTMSEIDEVGCGLIEMVYKMEICCSA